MRKPRSCSSIEILIECFFGHTIHGPRICLPHRAAHIRSLSYNDLRVRNSRSTTQQHATEYTLLLGSPKTDPARLKRLTAITRAMGQTSEQLHHSKRETYQIVLRSLGVVRHTLPGECRGFSALRVRLPQPTSQGPCCMVHEP
jgi:hypothetical protein